MHNAIAHHPLTDAWAVIRPSRPTPPVYILAMTFYGMEYSFIVYIDVSILQRIEVGHIGEHW